MKCITKIITVLSMLLSFGYVRAIESLSTTELASHCSYYSKASEGKNAIFCIRYIQGFIDGAVTTNERVISNISSEETFSERAMRIRLGKIKLYGSTNYANFCIGEPFRLKEVVNKIAQGLDNSKIMNKQLLARDAVYQTLRKNYPCKKKNMNEH